MAHLEPLSQPVNRPPNMNEKTFEELYTVTCSRHAVYDLFNFIELRNGFRLKVQF